jgi:transketolase
VPIVLRPGRDVTVFATGRMVSKALVAAAVLAVGGIEAEVVNVGSIKPLQADAVQRLATRTGCVVTAEEHNIHGGMGSAIAEALMPTRVPIVPVAVQDRFGQSAHSHEELLTEYGLTADAIVTAAHRARTLR